MQLLLKIALSVVIIVTATAVGRRLPSTAGLIGVMPLTGALVLVWLYLEKAGDKDTMVAFTKGALLGIVPSVLFFVVALVCFQKQLPLPWTLALSFGAWLAVAAVHQLILR
jgi:uncharacterized membrane protein (GlpM family)